MTITNDSNDSNDTVMTKKQIDDLFFLLFCEKNSNGTKHLRLNGKELYQRFNKRLESKDISKLCKFLLNHPEIISLDLPYNNLHDNGIEILADDFFSFDNNLLYLNLLHCDIDVNGLKALSKGKYLKLKGIRLLGNKFGYDGTRFIAKLIENCPTLENLDIAETDQTLESIESLLIVIEQSTLKSIDISRIIPNSLYLKYNDLVLADSCANLLKINKTLEVLRIEKFEFDGHDIEILLSGLKCHENLLLLDLTANRFSDHGSILIAEWLKTRPKLIVLKIASNQIRDVGASALAESLPFSRLRLLDLQNNKINDQGLCNLLDGIKKYGQLHILYLWGNEFSQNSLKKIGRLLLIGILSQEYIDVRIYQVDGQQYAAHYHQTDRFKHKMYCVQDYGYPGDLKIIHNEIPHPDALPRAKIDQEFIARYPPVDKKLPLKSYRARKHICDCQCCCRL